MTREDAKELLPIIQAFAEGEDIQIATAGEWKDVDESWAILFTEPPHCYRIKPKQKYRPFKSQEECWQEMHKHPDFGWVTDGYYKSTISVKSDSIVVTISSLEYDFGKAYIHFTFADGTPFGIKEE